MLNLIRGVLVIFTGFFGFVFGKDYIHRRKEGTLDDAHVIKSGIIGFIANFFDALGIGSFAPIVAMSKVFKANISDRIMPGTLNVSCTIPVITEAFILTTVIKVEPITLISLLLAATIGSYVGAGIIAKMDERKIQLVMGTALAITAVMMFLSHPKIDLMPGGGDAIGLGGIELIIGIVGNFILGALMTAGIGLYAPCMALVYFLGMSPKVAFPIMMGSCAMLMPVASVKFIKEGAYSPKASLAITICGMIGALIAALLVKTMPMDILKVLVIIVIAYTSFTMLKSALKSSEKKEEIK